MDYDLLDRSGWYLLRFNHVHRYFDSTAEISPYPSPSPSPRSLSSSTLQNALVLLAILASWKFRIQAKPTAQETFFKAPHWATRLRSGMGQCILGLTNPSPMAHFCSNLKSIQISCGLTIYLFLFLFFFHIFPVLFNYEYFPFFYFFYFNTLTFK